MDMWQALSGGSNDAETFGLGYPTGRRTPAPSTSIIESLMSAWNANPLESARAYLNRPDPEGYQRATVLPYATNAAGEVEWRFCRWAARLRARAWLA